MEGGRGLENFISQGLNEEGERETDRQTDRQRQPYSHLPLIPYHRLLLSERDFEAALRWFSAEITLISASAAPHSGDKQ